MKILHIVKIGFQVKKTGKLVGLKKVVPGIRQEYKETILMTRLVLKGKWKHKHVKEQAKDIGKLVFLFGIFMIPFAGSVLTGIVLSKLPEVKMSAFK